MLELPHVEATPGGTDALAEALRKGPRASNAARVLAAAVATCVHEHPVRFAAADSLFDRAREAAAAAAEAAAGRPGSVAPPERQPPAGSASLTQSRRTDPPLPRQGRLSSCLEDRNQDRSNSEACSVLVFERYDCGVSAEEQVVRAARWEARKSETMAARDEAATGKPRASSRNIPQCRAGLAIGYTSGCRTCPQTTRVAGATVSYIGVAGVNASAPDPYALVKDFVYGATLVPLRVLFERHHVHRSGRAMHTPVAAGCPQIKVLCARGPASAAFEHTRLQRELEEIVAARTKHQMLMVKALVGSVRSMWAAANESLRAFMDAFRADDLIDDKTCVEAEGGCYVVHGRLPVWAVGRRKCVVSGQARP